MLSLVADIGGTNSRFALCEENSLTLLEPRKYPNKEFDSLGDAIAHYIDDVKTTPTHACLAVAGPAHGDTISLTNIDWQFSVSDYQNRFGLTTLLITNDFTALAMSVPHLQKNAIRQIGTGTAIETMPISVVGPGTGLGVSGLIWNGAGWIAIQGEGGNAGFSPSTDLEIELLKRAYKDKSFVRSEDFISGNGLSYLHNLLLEINGKPAANVAAKDITWRAKTADCDECRNTINVFCGMLGNLAGNQALQLGALGGVYIGGGVAPQLDDLFVDSPFRKQFEAKGPFTDYISSIPTYLLLSHSRNALVGAAALLPSKHL